MSLNDFEIIRELGSGVFGSVFLVKRYEDGEIYALKRINIMNLNQEEKQAALNEARLLASLKNINIIRYKVAFYDKESKTLNIVMEYADDGDIESKLQENQLIKRAFDENTIWNWLIQILYGLKYLHENKVMHRDLKCANIFLTKDGIVKIGDLNVSRIARNGIAMSYVGTPLFMAPEIWDHQSYDYKSDIWSIGVILYELATLNLPFNGESIYEVHRKVKKGEYEPIPNIYSFDFGFIIRKMLVVDPEKRANIDDLINLEIVRCKMEQLGLDRIYREENIKESFRKSGILMETIKLSDLKKIDRILPNEFDLEGNHKLDNEKKKQEEINRQEEKKIYFDLLLNKKNTNEKSILKTPENNKRKVLRLQSPLIQHKNPNMVRDPSYKNNELFEEITRKIIKNLDQKKEQQEQSNRRRNEKNIHKNPKSKIIIIRNNNNKNPIFNQRPRISPENNQNLLDNIHYLNIMPNKFDNFRKRHSPVNLNVKRDNDFFNENSWQKEQNNGNERNINLNDKRNNFNQNHISYEPPKRFKPNFYEDQQSITSPDGWYRDKPSTPRAVYNNNKPKILRNINNNNRYLDRENSQRNLDNYLQVPIDFMNYHSEI